MELRLIYLPKRSSPCKGINYNGKNTCECYLHFGKNEKYQQVIASFTKLVSQLRKVSTK